MYKKCQDRHLRIISLTKKGYNRTEVAGMMNITRATVGNALRKVGMLNSIRVKGGKRGYRKTRRV